VEVVFILFTKVRVMVAVADKVCKKFSAILSPVSRELKFP
jgi:hypothetical protein